MKDYELIRQAYSQVEKHFIKIIDDAVFYKDDAERSRLTELSRINEYAYFVLFWGQFELFGILHFTIKVVNTFQWSAKL